jgi:hypothetical protein
MSTTAFQTGTPERATSTHASALAVRLEQGARALTAFAISLTDDEWQARIPHDGRTVGVVVHHVASVYPLEIQLAQTVADGKPVTGVTMADVDAMNAAHALRTARSRKPRRSNCCSATAPQPRPQSAN